MRTIEMTNSHRSSPRKGSLHPDIKGGLDARGTRRNANGLNDKFSPRKESLHPHIKRGLGVGGTRCSVNGLNDEFSPRKEPLHPYIKGGLDVGRTRCSAILSSILSPHSSRFLAQYSILSLRNSQLNPQASILNPPPSASIQRVEHFKTTMSRNTSVERDAIAETVSIVVMFSVLSIY